MKTTKLALASLALLAVAVAPAPATLLYTNANSTAGYLIQGSGNDGRTLGLKFTVGSSPIKVIALGVWDYHNDGLNAAHGVGLWTPTGTLVASNTVYSTDTAVLDVSGGVTSSFRLNSTLFDPATGNPFSSPLILLPGTSYVLGDFQTAGEPYLSNGAPASYASDVTYGGAYYSGVFSALSRPDTFAPGAGGYFGPNLEFDVIVPEPSTLLLLGMGGLVLAWVRRQSWQRGRA